jgi:RNA polymerase sigma-70 factor (ECF subfamily)
LSDSRFENLVNEYGRQVLNVALRILGDADLAKDAHQEVFLAVWQRWHTYNGTVNWRAYLYRVAVRKAMEIARSRQAGPVSVDGPEPQSPTGGPDIPLRTVELHQKLTASLAKLSKRQAEVFVLARIEGLDCAAVAEVLGCSQNTVRVHLHRATRELAREMRSYLG